MHAREDAARNRREDEVRGGPRPRQTKTSEAGLLALQQTSGNAAVARLVQRQRAGHGTKKPPPKKKAELIHGRVLSVQVMGDKTHVNINKGSEAGVEEWMTGYLAGDDGKSYADITVVKVSGGQCDAETTATPDEVSKHVQAFIDPSTTIRRGD